MLRRYEQCLVFSLPAIGSWKIEFVYAPAGYSIREHTHNGLNIKLIPLFCHNVMFYRRKKGELFGERFYAWFRHIGRVFTINSGDAHYFDVSKWPLIFMNIEHWLVQPTSAAEDLQLTTTH